MGLAAGVIARLLERYRWIAYVGLAVILYVALRMIYDGAVRPRSQATSVSRASRGRRICP